MLQEKPNSRPNIYQVVKEVCIMQGTEIPIPDVSLGANGLCLLPNMFVDLCWKNGF